MEQKIIVTTFVKLDFIDSLKCLFGRSLKVEQNILVLQDNAINAYNAWAKIEVVNTSTHFVKQDKPNYGYTHKPE